MQPFKKILLAVGGTGGHLFPAQALARDLMQRGGVELLFAGHGLSTNRYFKRDRFPFVDIQSATPRKNPVSLIKIARGVWESRKLLARFEPDLVIGFGSFHSFPLLLTASMKKVPYVLFSPDAIPGLVNRIFSKRAHFTAIQFQNSAQHLKGTTVSIRVPCWCLPEACSQEEARRFYGLEADRLTLLVFGGSQGAAVLNRAIAQLTLDRPFQLIHLVGAQEPVEPLIAQYKSKGIPAFVAPFEDRMERAYRAADLAICRAGAVTIGELVEFELPSLLVPWPGAADQHQQINATAFVQQTGGGRFLLEKMLSPLLMKETIEKMDLKGMQKNLSDYKQRELGSRFVDRLEELF